MRVILGIVIGVFLLAFLACLPSKAFAIDPVNCQQSNVQFAIDNTASGGTVNVPSGNCTWASTVTITGKALTLTGAGQGVTNITDQVAGSNSVALSVVASATNFVTVSGFTFISGIVHANGIVAISGTQFSQAFRLHHSTFTNTHIGGRGLGVNEVYGLVDHATFNTTGSTQSLRIQGGFIDGGYLSWQRPLSLGTADAVYIEQSTFNKDSSAGEDSIDIYRGARSVIRYNTFNNAHGGHHGTDSGGLRSPVSLELYNNNFHNNVGTVNRAWTWRGGTGVVFNNTYDGSIAWNGVAVQYFRACSYNSTMAGWGINGCTGTNFVVGSTTFSDTAARTGCDITTGPVPGVGGCAAFPSVDWKQTTFFCSGNRDKVGVNDAACAAQSAGTATTYLDGSLGDGYPGRDQPGRGPNGQGLEPVYVWGNTGLAGSTIGPFPSDAGSCHGLNPDVYLLDTRDFYTDGRVRPGYAAYTYPHPLQGGDTLAPAAPTNITVSKLERH